MNKSPIRLEPKLRITEMPDLDEHKLAKLALEMAMNIRDYKKIFEDFQITEEDYYAIEKIPFYLRAKEQYTLEWNSTTSTKERLVLSTAFLTEQIAPILGARAMNPAEPLQAAGDILKTMARLAGVGEAKQTNANAAERFIITINLGADVDGKPIVEHYDKPITPDASLTQIPTHIPQITAPAAEDLSFAALSERD